jgi:hypothetical protein
MASSAKPLRTSLGFQARKITKRQADASFCCLRGFFLNRRSTWRHCSLALQSKGRDELRGIACKSLRRSANHDPVTEYENTFWLVSCLLFGIRRL